MHLAPKLCELSYVQEDLNIYHHEPLPGPGPVPESECRPLSASLVSSIFPGSSTIMRTQEIPLLPGLHPVTPGMDIFAVMN